MDRTTLEIIVGLIAIMAFLGTVLGVYAQMIRREINDRRDYEHLKRNYDNLNSMISHEFKDLERNLTEFFTEFTEMKMLILTQMGLDKHGCKIEK